jgi:hypothetical protein
MFIPLNFTSEPLAAKILIREVFQYIPIAVFTTDRSTLMKKLFW